MLIEGVVGPRQLGDGSESPLRLGKDESLITSDAHGPYYENTSRGKVFSGMTAVAGTTVVAANVSPIAAAAASILSLYNPLGSGVNVEVLKAWLNFISGTPGAGAWVYNIAFNQAVTATQNNGSVSGTGPQSNYASGGSGVAKIFTQTALTGSGLQVLLRPTGAVLFAAAIAATTPGLQVTDLVDGDIVLPPGGLLSIAAPAVGTTLVLAAGFEWAEIALP